MYKHNDRFLTTATGAGGGGCRGGGRGLVFLEVCWHKHVEVLLLVWLGWHVRQVMVLFKLPHRAWRPTGFQLWLNVHTLTIAVHGRGCHQWLC